MRRQGAVEKREPVQRKIEADLAVVGGGLAGVCCAITAARAGVRVALIQDRPVLGGNASSEVRLWILGATSHMGNNNRWAREGGLVDEILVENLWRNPEGNPVILDTILLEKVTAEPNITLLLNAAVFGVEKSGPDTIQSARAFCSQNSTLYEVSAPLFCDASGDGILGFLAGAPFRMGAESREEFGEKFAPSSEYGELLGHSIYFYSKDTGRPVHFTPPAYALKDVTQVPRWRSFNAKEYGCRLWWIEWGGRLDTVHDTERIKWELWKVVHGVWDHIKNSGQFPEAENLTLEWVGLIPGKRESRRFEGPYMLREQDIVEQRYFDDAVSYGGWSIDLHPADGVFSEKPGCNQWHSRGVYHIPYRCLYSASVGNLFLAGRIISASHVAFGSTRVMATCAHSAQAVGIAAALCARHGWLPAAVSCLAGWSDASLPDGESLRPIRLLQRELMRAGQYIPGFRLEDPNDLARTARITASSRFVLRELPPGRPVLMLTSDRAQMIPVGPGRSPRISFLVHASASTTLRMELRTSDRPDNHTADVMLGEHSIELPAGVNHWVTLDVPCAIREACYLFAILRRNDLVAVQGSDLRVTGILALRRTGRQQPAEDVGVQTFDFWTPERRPGGHNLAIRVDPALDLFGPENVTNGVARPTCGPNAWVADPSDSRPALTLVWDSPQTIGRIELGFDTDFDHPMESVLMGHPERAIPFCVKHYRTLDFEGRVLAETTDNHQTRNTIHLNPPARTDRITIELLEAHGPVPSALFEVRCYAN